MEHIISKIEDYLLTCPVCFEPAFSEGRDFQSLPCQHQLCDVCIKKWQRNGKITCPVCQKQFKAIKFPTLLPTKQLSELIASFQEELKLIDEHQSFTVGEAQQSKQEDRSTLTFSMIKQYSLCQHYPGLNELIITNKAKVYISSPTTAIRKLDFSARRKWTQFGHQDSIYFAAMVYNNQLLYVYNTTTNHIEVYQDEKLVTKWKLEFPELNYEVPCHTIRDSISIQSFPDGVLVSISINLCDGSIEDVYKIFQPGKKYMIEVDPQYLRSTSTKQYHLICRFLHRNRVLCIHRDSLWFVDRRDRHLMELPFKYAKHALCRHRVLIKEPIRHFKIPDFKLGCGFNHKLFYITEKSNHIYQLDLSQLPSLAKLRIRNNRVLYTQPKVLEPTVVLGLPKNTHLNALDASENGNLVTADDKDVIRLYQQPDQQATVMEVGITNEVEPGPEYPTQYQNIKKTAKGVLRVMLLPFRIPFRLFQWCIFPIEIFIFIMILTTLLNHIEHYFVGGPDPYEELSDIMARACLQSPTI